MRGEPFLILIDEVVMGIAVATLFIGSYEDIKSREVDRFLFIPLVLVGSIGMFFDQASPSLDIIPVILFPVALFFSLFVKFVPWFYALIGIAFFAIFLYFSPSGYFLDLAVILLIYLLGLGERFFGTGDIKAMLAICTGFSSPFIYDFVKPTFAQSIFPFDFGFLFTLSIVSMFSVFYVLAMNFRSGQHLGVQSFFSFGYDEDKLKKNPERYSVREFKGKQIMVYRLPFIVPIFISFLIASAFGNWFVV